MHPRLMRACSIYIAFVKLAANVANVWITAQRSTIGSCTYARIVRMCVRADVSESQRLSRKRAMRILINRRLTMSSLTINDTLPRRMSHLCQSDFRQFVTVVP